LKERGEVWAGIFEPDSRSAKGEDEMVMRYIRLCYDRPGTEQLRNTLRAIHRAYFQDNLREGSAVRVIDAGPLCVNDSDDTNIASFMIIEANSKADVVKFHDNDPFTKANLYERVDIERWDQHFANGKKLI
jgi:uncharacterized protein